MNFVVRANDRETFRTLRAIKGGVMPLTVDFSPWADDNGALTGATWSVIGGNASLSDTSLSNSVASVTVTTADRGDSTIEVKGANASYTQPIRIRVSAIEPQALPMHDYGFHR